MYAHSPKVIVMSVCFSLQLLWSSSCSRAGSSRTASKRHPKPPSQATVSPIACGILQHALTMLDTANSYNAYLQAWLGWLQFTETFINITDRNLAACVNYNHLLNLSEPANFMRCFSESDKIAADVARAVSDDGSVLLDVKHGTEGAYICECRFSKMTFLREQDKYMVSSINRCP